MFRMCQQTILKRCCFHLQRGIVLGDGKNKANITSFKESLLINNTLNPATTRLKLRICITLFDHCIVLEGTDGS